MLPQRVRQPGRFPRALLLLLALTQTAVAQSFDCAKALSRSERAICADPALADLDLRLAHTLAAALAIDPPAAGAVRAAQRAWLTARESTCAPAAAANSGACLAQYYQTRIRALEDGRSVADDASTQVCRTVADRYRSLADRHAGESPLDVLVATPGSGLILQNPLASGEDGRDVLISWARNHTPPLVLPPQFVTDLDGEFVELNALPGTSFHAFDMIGGTAHCYSSTYFQVEGDRLRPLPDPPGIDNQEGAGCGVRRAYGALDGQPVIIEQSYDYSPSMIAGLVLARWEGSGFAGACQLRLDYAPQFDVPTLNEAPPACKAANCTDWNKRARDLAVRVQADPARAVAERYAALNPEDRSRFREVQERLSRDPSATFAQPAKQGGHAEDITEEQPLLLPVVVQDQLYLVRIGHRTIGWRWYADWSVVVQRIVQDQLIDVGEFAVGMQRGRLLGLAIAPIKRRASRAAGASGTPVP